MLTFAQPWLDGIILHSAADMGIHRHSRVLVSGVYSVLDISMTLGLIIVPIGKPH
jgi:hypothetical protein